jgi:hypothetical protein
LSRAAKQPGNADADASLFVEVAMPRQTSRHILIIADILFIISLVPLALAPSFAVRAAWRAAPGSRRFLVYLRCGPDMSFQKSGGARVLAGLIAMGMVQR